MITFSAAVLACLLANVWLMISGSTRSQRWRLAMTAALSIVFVVAYIAAPLWQIYLLGLSGMLLVFSASMRSLPAKLIQAAALVLISATGFLSYLFPAYQPATPDGKYHVGYVALYHEMTRPKIQASSRLDERLIPVKIWFPTEASEGERVGFDDLLVGLKARYAHLPIPDWVLNNLSSSVTGATISSSVIDMKLPTIVYNHGGGSYPEDNRVLLESLASNGYVAISIGHPLSSSAIRYPNGDLIHADFDAYGRTSLSYAQQLELNDQWNRTFTVDSYEEYFDLISDYITAPDPSTKQVSDWVAETLSVLHDLRSLPVVGANIDQSRIAFAGYSIGGATAIELCRVEDICRAVINLDGLPAGRPGIMETDLGKPFLVISSNKTAGAIDKFTPNQFLAVQNSGDSYNFLIPEATHSQFSSEGYYSPAFSIGFGYSTATYYRTQKIMTDLILGFMDRHVAGKATQALPDPSATVSIIHH